MLPCLFALGANVPGYETVWRWLPGLDSTRVPERFMPIACLALGALAAFGIERLTTLVLIHHKLVPSALAGVAIVLFAADLRVPVFGAVAPDRPSEAYSAIRGPGRLLELPVFRPDVHFGSAYLAYARQSPRERPQGYSTLAAPRAVGLARELRGLACGRGDVPPALGIRFVDRPSRAVRPERLLRSGCPRRAEAKLRDGRLAPARPRRADRDSVHAD